RSVAGTGQRQSNQLWLHFLADRKAFGSGEVCAALKLAVDYHFELVIPSSHIADVDSLNATLSQGLELFEAVNVVRNELAVDLEPYGIEAHLIALGQRDEDRDLRP